MAASLTFKGGSMAGKRKGPAQVPGLSEVWKRAGQPPITELGSTFTPGPIVEETAMRWM